MFILFSFKFSLLTCLTIKIRHGQQKSGAPNNSYKKKTIQNIEVIFLNFSFDVILCGNCTRV